MTTNPTPWAMSRRDMLRLGAGLAGGSLLAACSSSPNAKPPTSKPSSKTLTLPTFKAGRALPGAITSANPLVPMAFETFPTPYQSVSQKPMAGGGVDVFMLIWGSAPPPMSQNTWWQNLNKELGGQWNPTLVPAAVYDQRVATMLASGKIPDLSWIQPDYSAPTAQAVQQGAFANLTEALAGDAVMAYPNLAQIPTYAWERSSVNGSIYGVPHPLYLLNQVDVYRADWAEKLGYPEPPKNADEVLALFTAFSKGNPAGSTQTWGVAAFDLLLTTFVSNMFRVPNRWRLNKDGTFTSSIETDEYEAALTYMNKMWKAGVFHPDALLYQTQTDKIPDLFTAGRTGFYRPPSAAWFAAGTYADQLLEANPDARAELLVTPGHDGGTPLNQQTDGWYGIASISAEAGRDKERLGELLRVLDYLAAPFGSEEFLSYNYGLEGRHYTLDDKGNPVPTEDPKILSELGAGYFISPAESTLYYPGTQGRATKAHAYYAAQLENSVSDPALGLVSETNMSKGAVLSQLNTSYQNDIVSGRKPLSALTEWRSRWRSQGGDKVRQEYQEALQQSK